MPRIMIALAIAFIAVCGVALAQDVAVTTPTGPAAGETLVDVNSWYALLQPYLTMIATTLITAAVAWLTAQMSKWTGMKIEGEHRDAFQTALTNGAGLLIQTLGTKASTMKGLDVHSKAVVDAIDYVQKSAQDAIVHFGITPAAIAEKLEAKLGLLTPVGGVGETPATVISGGLK